MIDLSKCRQFTSLVGGTTVHQSFVRLAPVLTDAARLLFQKDKDNIPDEPGEATFIALKVGQLVPGKKYWKYGLLHMLDREGDEFLPRWSEENLGAYVIRLCQKTDVIRILPHNKAQPVDSILYVAMKLIRDTRGTFGPRAFTIGYPLGGKQMIDVCVATAGAPTRSNHDVLFRLTHA